MADNQDVSATALEFFDPHFHIWDMTPVESQPDVTSEPLKRYSASSDPKGTVSGHDASILFEPNGSKCYGATEYEAELAPASKLVAHTGGVFIEAASVCFTKTPGDNQFFADACLVEAAWVSSELAKSDKTYALMGTASLEAPNALATLEALAEYKQIKGIRQIVNHTPDWPRNGMLGDLLDNPEWQKGYGLLKEVGFAFDMQLNPPQFGKAAALIAKHPETTVIINHLGSPTLADIVDADKKKIFDDGMAALAACPHVYLKISMLCYTDPKWDENAQIVDTVKGLIKLFGVDRCCFASNYPVDTKDGWTAERLITAFLKLVANLSAADQQKIFSGNARKAYSV